MAVTGSFRQQCPSCEAMVLVKDPKQAGKKIDCPNCKFRFVVEDPNAKEETAEAEEATVEEEEAKPKAKSNTAVTAKKPTQPAVPAPADKKKPKKKKRVADDDEEDEDRPRKKAKGGSMVMILGIGLSAAALLILGIGGYFLFFVGKDGGGHAVRSTRPTGTRPTGPQSTKPDTVTDSKLVEMTGLLPNEAQSVLNVNVKDLVGGSAGRAAFDTPGAFKQKYFDSKLGMALRNIERLLLAQNTSKPWLFAVVRTNQPIDLEQLKKNANLQVPADNPYKKQEYFLTEPTDWLDRIAQVLTGQAGPPAKPRQFAVRVVDSQTLVLADSPEFLKTAFLDANGQPKPRSKPAGKGPGGQQASSRYLTISPELKGLLDLLEAKPVLLSWAMEMEPIKDTVTQTAEGTLKGLGLPPVGGLNDVRTIGAAVQTRDQVVVTLGLDYRDVPAAKSMQESFRTRTEELAKSNLLGLARLPFQVEVDGRQMITLPPPPPMPMPTPTPAPLPPKITVKSQVHEQTFLVSADIVLSHEANSLRIQQYLQPIMIRLRGDLEMVGSPPRIHDLAAALTALVSKEQKFPRGTFTRPIEKERRGRPHPPDDRVGWMVELLPHLDLGELRRQVNTDKSWRDIENALEGVVLVPAFLDPTSPSFTWWVQVPSVPGRHFATTQFVGMAGVGLDAAEYEPSDAAVAGKLGIFGYERETAVDRIKDGAASTIALIQVPPLYKRPWLAGGGATVQGVPEKESIKPFVCVSYEVAGKPTRGTFAIMADGAVRFVPETISDEAFKALCTIAGGEKVDLEKETVLLPPPGKAELKTKE